MGEERTRATFTKNRECAIVRTGTVTMLRGGKHVESCELARELTRGGIETRKQLAKVRRQRGKANDGASAQFVVHRSGESREHVKEGKD